MGGENNIADKVDLTYKKLIVAVLENKPLPIILKRVEVLERQIGGDYRIPLYKVLSDAKRMIWHTQGGRSVPVPIDSPIGQILIGNARKSGGHGKEISKYLGTELTALTLPFEEQKDVQDYLEKESVKLPKKSIAELIETGNINTDD